MKNTVFATSYDVVNKQCAEQKQVNDVFGAVYSGYSFSKLQEYWIGPLVILASIAKIFRNYTED
jgi:hypothetical protein